MLIGEFTHTLDTKRRVALPAKFRKELGKSIVITHGFDKCLFVYPAAAWRNVLDKLSALSMGKRESRGLNRFLLGGAVETNVDSLGRVLIPDFLKSFAGLKTRVSMIGVNDRVEIWDGHAWRTYKESIDRKADTLAEELGDLGVL